MQITVIIFMLTNVANVFQMQYVINIIINKGNTIYIAKAIIPKIQTNSRYKHSAQPIFNIGISSFLFF